MVPFNRSAQLLVWEVEDGFDSSVLTQVRIGPRSRQRANGYHQVAVSRNGVLVAKAQDKLSRVQRYDVEKAVASFSRFRAERARWHQARDTFRRLAEAGGKLTANDIREWTTRHVPSVRSIFLTAWGFVVDFVACESEFVPVDGPIESPTTRLVIGPLRFVVRRDGRIYGLSLVGEAGKMTSCHPHLNGHGAVCLGGFEEEINASFELAGFQWATLIITSLERWRRRWAASVYVNPLDVIRNTFERFNQEPQAFAPMQSADGEVYRDLQTLVERVPRSNVANVFNMVRRSRCETCGESMDNCSCCESCGEDCGWCHDCDRRPCECRCERCDLCENRHIDCGCRCCPGCNAPLVSSVPRPEQRYHCHNCPSVVCGRCWAVLCQCNPAVALPFEGIRTAAIARRCLQHLSSQPDCCVCRLIQHVGASTLIANGLRSFSRSIRNITQADCRDCGQSSRMCACAPNAQRCDWCRRSTLIRQHVNDGTDHRIPELNLE